MNLYINNRVCSRRIMVVKNEFIKMGIYPTSVELGEVELKEELTADQKSLLNSALLSFGFRIICKS